MNDWYKGMKAEDIQGIHVLATGCDGSRVEGRPDGDGVVAGNAVFDMESNRGSSQVKSLSDGVENVMASWDERYWRPIPADDARAGDAVIVNGTAYPVLDVQAECDDDDIPVGRKFKSWADNDNCRMQQIFLPMDSVSCAIRRKTGIDPPSGSGIYEGHDGSLWIMDDHMSLRIKAAGICIFVGLGDAVPISPSAFPLTKLDLDDEESTMG